MQERFSRGRAISIPPFGYRMSKEGFEPQPEQAVWIPVIFREYANGKHAQEIAAELNRKGVKTSRGNPFQSRSIVYILNNPVYLGKLRKRCLTSSTSRYADENSPIALLHDRNYLFTTMEFAEGNHMPLVDQTVWEQVQKRLYREYAGAAVCKPGLSTSSVSECSTCYYLQKMIRCSCCGRYLVQVRKGNAFQCSGYNHGTCQESHYIKRERLEALVLEAIQPFLTPSASVFLQQASCSPEERNTILRLSSQKLIYNSRKQQIETVPEEI